MATLTTLQSQVRYLTNTNTADYSDDEINANLTRWTHLFTTEILDAMDMWDFQGEISTANLVANQNEYVFPLDVLKVKRVEISYDGTNWYDAQFIDVSQRGSALTGNEINDFSTTNPKVELYDDSMFLYPTPTSDVTAGFKIWYSEEVVGKNASGEDITSFSTATDKPNIREAFQRGLVWGCVQDYAMKIGNTNQFQLAGNEIEKIIQRARTFYGDRVQDVGMTIQGSSSLENYE